MDRENQAAPNKGCFQWVLRTGRSLNGRWAKSRNNLRKRFHKKHPEYQPVSTHNLINDTGTPDMELIKVPMIPRPPLIGQVEFTYDRVYAHNGQQTNDGHIISGQRDLREILSEDILAGAKQSATPDLDRAVNDMSDHVNGYADGLIHRAEDVLKADTGGGDIAQAALKEDEVSGSDDYDVISCSSIHACISSTASHTTDFAEAAVDFTLTTLTLDSDDDY